MRPLGTIVVTKAQLTAAPWSAVLISAATVMRRWGPLPQPAWQQVVVPSARFSYATPLPEKSHRFPVYGTTPLLCGSVMMDRAQPWAFALTPDASLPLQQDRLLTALRQLPPPQFVRFDNWNPLTCTKTDLLNPEGSYTPSFLSQLLQVLPPETPLILTRRTLTQVVHDCGLVRLWDALLFPEHPLPASTQRFLRSTMTGLCPNCEGMLRSAAVPGRRGTFCHPCQKDWDITKILLSPVHGSWAQTSWDASQTPQ